MQEVLSFFKENPIFFISTIEEDQPRVRPFGAVAEFEGNLYICTNNQKKVFQQIQENPKVEICGMAKDGGWLRVEAVAISDNRTEAKTKMIEENPSLKSMYSPEDSVFEVLYLKDATATFASFASEPRIIKF